MMQAPDHDDPAVNQRGDVHSPQRAIARQVLCEQISDQSGQVVIVEQTGNVGRTYVPIDVERLVDDPPWRGCGAPSLRVRIGTSPIRDATRCRSAATSTGPGTNRTTLQVWPTIVGHSRSRIARSSGCKASTSPTPPDPDSSDRLKSLAKAELGVTT
jgi:hypothetical protein